MENYSMQFIDKLFKKYYGKEYLAVKECKNIYFKGKTEIKKIAMQYNKLSLGGVERVISLLASMFLEIGYEVVVITEEINPSADYDFPKGVEILTIPIKKHIIQSMEYIERAKAIHEIVESKNIDLVCYHEASTNFLLYDFLTYKQSLVNFILVKHEYISQYMVGLSDSLYNQKSVFPLIDKMVVLSSAEKLFWDKMGVNVEYIYNPLGKYAISETDKNVKENKEKNILWIGRLDNQQKQYLDIVPIMKNVVKKVPSAVLQIYGNEWDNGAIQKLNDLILTEHLEENIKYCGYITDNIDSVYAKTDVHLVTSAYESFPMVIYESRVNGIPLVLYKMPYLEVLRENKGYIEVENDDISGAAEAIVKILTEDELRQRMSKEALESITLYTDKELKTIWKNAIDSLVNEKKLENKIIENEEETMKVILDTMLYHYHKGCSTHKKYLNEMRESFFCDKVVSIVSAVIKIKKLPIVIYPYGKQGKQVKRILNEILNIQEVFVVDNNIVNENMDIKTVAQLKNIDCTKYWFLICSNNKRCYDEIRNCISDVVPCENIVDLFPQI